MCYASPGPRCEAHAKDRFNALSIKASSKLEKFNEADKEMKSYASENPDTYKDSKKYKNLEKKRNSLYSEQIHADAEARAARREMDATSGGLASLKSELKAHTIEDDPAERIKLQMRIEAGEKTYSKKMMAYDIAKGTVNGRQPSPYGSPEGLKMLKKPLQKANEEYDKAITGPEKKAAMEKQKAARKSLEHAKLTYERVKQGKVDPDKASYRENRAKYKDIAKRHSEAGKKLQETIRESLKPNNSVPFDVLAQNQNKAREAYVKVNEEKIACEAKLTRAEMGKY